MISKFEIALKEANETENWLTIFKNSDLIEEQLFDIIHKKLVKIKILLISSIKTLKGIS
ncbi:MAG: four helix bundle protein [Clostridia bacterium]|nr:four helix bundle protein [Clostridia bacterium]